MFTENFEILDDLDLFLEILPKKITKNIEKKIHELIEVVLDLGRPPVVIYSDHKKTLESEIVSALDISFVLGKLGHVGDDNRAGIEKTLHRISLMRNRSGKTIGLTCRVGRAVFGSIKIIEDFIGNGKSILIMGKPGIGKTTMLREITRLLADKEEKRVVVIDTSNEIAGDGDIPHPAIGSARRMQVKNTDLQHNVMIEAVENHMPEVIVIDEISTEKEAKASRTIAERGVQLIATAHGNTLDNLIINPTLSDLIGGIKSVTLGDIEARRRKTQKTVLEREFEPTFDILVEIINRNEVTVHFDVGLAVDKKLRGITTTTEIRKISDGKLLKLKDENKKIEDYKIDTDSIEITKNDISLKSKEKINVFPYGLQKTKLKKLAKSFVSNIKIVSNPELAKIILTTKANYSKEPKPKIIEMAEKIGIPIHLIKKGSSDQIARFLEKISYEKSPNENLVDNKLDTDNSEALNEVKIAIKKIKNGENEIELSPQNSNIRRKQHFFATNEGVGSISIGDESKRRIVLKKRL
jgi:stage III sporulation protein SpoIIIAA